MKKSVALPYLLVLPAVLGILIFSFYPFVSNLINSFMYGTAQAGTLRFVGLANYRYVLKDPVLIKALLNTIIWTLTVTLLQFGVGFAFALFCSGENPVMRLLKPLYALPWAIPGIVATLSWRWMYNGDFGILNSILMRTGLISTNIGWLSDPKYAMLSVVILGVWKGFPYYLLMMFAGLKSVPVELYEAATIDGASRFQGFYHVTLPQMRVIIGMALTLGFIWTSNYYDGIYALTGGGPARATETLPIYIYNTAFAAFNLNDAVIPSIILFLFACILGVIYMKFKSRNEEEIG